ncbi:NAD(P)/FAD-dependent oxidoreductase [Aureimonas populi]|uniref:NAD(P)/FAD-dependent oxidoreductase n=1 Tax=Aureimonas populi TaxID=1701758 RepID=A0ABW5CQB4_9HYPH|nr:FAD-binding oxidoreductase [Aureimonas populi]
MSRIAPDPVPSGPLPAAVDVVVIGGGIVGVSTALFLAQKGVSVALCEKGLIGAEQSGRNWGWVRQMGRDPAEIPLAVQSLAIWRGLNARVGAETGYRQTGISYLCRTEAEMAEYSAWLDHARDHGIDTRMLDRAALADLLPGISGEFIGGLHTASDGRAEPLQAAAAIARAAAAAGAHIVTACAVRGIERAAGAVSGVVTEHGPVRCSTVVLAGGAWSRLFAGNLGIDLPMLKVLGSVARISGVAGVAGVPDMPVGADNFSFRRRLDGGFSIALRNVNVVPVVPDSFRLFTDFAPSLIRNWKELRIRIGKRFLDELRMPRRWALDRVTPFERMRVLDPVPEDRFLKDALVHLQRGFPAFAGARITQSWGGLIDTTPDAVPVMDRVPGIPGFYIAGGFSGHGFGIGPGSGQMMAQMVTGETPLVDPAPFRLGRFRRQAAHRARERQIVGQA